MEPTHLPSTAMPWLFKLVGTTPELMRQRSDKPLHALLCVLGCQAATQVLLIVLYAYGTSWRLLFTIPAAAAVLAYSAFAFSLRLPVELLLHSKPNLVMTIGIFPAMFLVICSNLQPSHHVPFQSRAVLTLAQVLQFALLLSMTEFTVPQRLEKKQGSFWKAVIQALISVARPMDALSDIGLCAQMYFGIAARDCSWDGVQDCNRYHKLLIAMAVAAAVDFVVGYLIFLTTSWKAHIPLHIMDFASEFVILYASYLAYRHGNPQGQYSSTAFLLVSTLLTIACTVTNLTMLTSSIWGRFALVKKATALLGMGGRVACEPPEASAVDATAGVRKPVHSTSEEPPECSVDINAAQAT